MRSATPTIGGTTRPTGCRRRFEKTWRSSGRRCGPSRPRRPAVDLESADDPYVSRLVRHYGELARDLWALDVTSDLGVPTFAAISRRVDAPEEDVIYGFGSHLDPA